MTLILLKCKAIRHISDSSCKEIPIDFRDSSGSELDKNEVDNCRGCGKNYYKTQLVEDWLHVIYAKCVGSEDIKKRFLCYVDAKPVFNKDLI